MFARHEIDVVVTLGEIDKYALQFLEKNHIAAVGLESNIDIHRLCRVFGAEAATIYDMPDQVQLGAADSVIMDKVQNSSLAIFEVQNNNSEIKTIIVKNVAYDDFDNSLDNFEFDTFVPGAGATEIELARAITSFALVDQPSKRLWSAIQKFASALEIFPRSLAENIGKDPDEALRKLYATHEEGQKTFGVDIQGENWIINSAENNFLDSYSTKYWGP